MVYQCWKQLEVSDVTFFTIMTAMTKRKLKREKRKSELGHTSKSSLSGASVGVIRSQRGDNYEVVTSSDEDAGEGNSRPSSYMRRYLIFHIILPSSDIHGVSYICRTGLQVTITDMQWSYFWALLYYSTEDLSKTHCLCSNSHYQFKTAQNLSGKALTLSLSFLWFRLAVSVPACFQNPEVLVSL